MKSNGIKITCLLALLAMTTLFIGHSTPISSAHQQNSDSKTLFYTLSDPYASSQTTPWGIERINATEAAAEADYFQEVDIAILDTGLDCDHEDFHQQDWFLAHPIKWTFNERTDEEGKSAVEDGNGHGTHCTGITTAVDNDIGVVGVAPKINTYVIKVMADNGTGTLQDVADGIRRAAKGPDGEVDTDDDADVISMSLGAPSSSDKVKDAVNYAYNHGTVLVAAAGNYDPIRNPDREVMYPAKYDKVIGVGAINKNGEEAYFSARGIQLELAAPGVDIYSTFKDNSYKSLKGTSMACPHIVATVTLVIAEDLEDGYKDLTIGTIDSTNSYSIRGILHTTTSSDPSHTGWGIVDAYAAVLAVPLHQSAGGPTPTPL